VRGAGAAELVARAEIWFAAGPGTSAGRGTSAGGDTSAEGDTCAGWVGGGVTRGGAATAVRVATALRGEETGHSRQATNAIAMATAPPMTATIGARRRRAL
jgi:hypothetical protein